MRDAIRDAPAAPAGRGAMCVGLTVVRRAVSSNHTMCCRVQTMPSRRSSLCSVRTVVRASAPQRMCDVWPHYLTAVDGDSANTKLAEAVRASVAAMLSIGESHHWQLRVLALATLNAHVNGRSCWGDIVAPANRCGTDAGLFSLHHDRSLSASVKLRRFDRLSRAGAAVAASAKVLSISRSLAARPAFTRKSMAALITGSSRTGRETAVRPCPALRPSRQRIWRAPPGPRSGISRAIIPSQPSRTTSNRADRRADPKAGARAHSHRCCTCKSCQYTIHHVCIAAVLSHEGAKSRVPSNAQSAFIRVYAPR
jgi:hypothetical protein